MTQAAMQARLPAAPVSPAYSLMSQDHAKLKYLFGLIKPAVVMVQDGPTFEKALKALDLTGVTVIHVARPCRRHREHRLCRSRGDAGDERRRGLDREDHARHRRQAAVHLGLDRHAQGRHQHAGDDVRQCRDDDAGAAARSRTDRSPPCSTGCRGITPWAAMPRSIRCWSTAARSISTTAGRCRASSKRRIRNLREVSPTYYANVPAGYAALAAAMEKDDALCRSFFKNLSIMAYGGARLPDDLYDRMQALAVKTTGERIVFYTGWGSTETAPTATGTYWDTERVGLIGLPFPGVELKMVPCGSKYELRLRGINVTPGYFGQPELTEEDVRRGRLLLHRRCRRVRRSRRSRGRASSSPAAWSRISSSPPAPSSMSARSAPMRSRPPRRWCMTRWSRGRIVRSSACWPGPICMPAASSSAIPRRASRMW